jgi:hypothetical protein
MKNLLFVVLIALGVCSCNNNKSVVTSDDTDYVSDSTSSNVVSNEETALNEESEPEINTEKYSDESVKYFNSVATKSEFSSGKFKPHRWRKDMKIYVKGDKPDYLMNELNKIVGELNDIINTINIKVVNSESESNFVIFFGGQSGYNEICSTSIGLTEHNYGLFVVDGGVSIGGGSMYVDTERSSTTSAKKHLLREELTQSFGLFNDTYDYPNSIFYQGWTETNQYAPIDIELISMLYN